MTKLGIITCQILELEFAHILSNDPDISEIWIVADAFSKELIEILEDRGLQQVHRASNMGELDADETIDIAVLVRVMEVGLHSNISTLRQEVVAAVKDIAPFVNAVLLGYGLCGNALNNTSELFDDIRIPVMLPMQNEKPVDDCVSLIIGGTENYYEEQCRCAGTMFMNAGFSRHWDKILSMNIPTKLIHKKDKILDRIWGHYKRSLLLTTPVLGEKELRDNTKDFNDRFGLKTETRAGTLSILENAWKELKKAAI
jgi:hypothetical protein